MSHLLAWVAAVGASKARPWFAQHVVGDASRRASATHDLDWPPGLAFRDLALNLTTTEPDPRLDYLIVRPWPDSAKTGIENVEGWLGGEELAEIHYPRARTREAHVEFLRSLDSDGGALVVRELERLPWVRWAARRVAKSMGRSLWGHDRVHVFHTRKAKTGSYGWHFDRSDNILFVVAGNKRFRVAGRKRHSDAVLDVNLTANSAIYIPRKLFHNGVGLDDQGSTLVSIALKPYSETRAFFNAQWRRRRNQVKDAFRRTSDEL